MSQADDRRRAESPPPQYWRRWTSDAPAPGEAPPAAPVPPASPAQESATSEVPIRVLVVEDDPSQALYAESVLKGAGMQVRVSPEAGGVIPGMEEFRPDLVLMDLHMPGMDGAELTVLIRNHPELGLTPIVFLTGDSDPERQYQALDIGADDFLVKPVRPRHLIAAVQNRVRRARSLRDPFAGRHSSTGLHTRARILQLLSEAIPASPTGAVFFLEIEGISALRDRIGYIALETVLTEAGRCVGRLANGNPASRLNDNTFLVFVPEIQDAELPVFARSLRDGLGEQRFTVNGDTLRLRALAGYVALSHGFGDAGSALSAAEHALRDARTSPTRTSAWQPPTTSEQQHDSELARLLHAAIDGGPGFELAYQPIVAVAGGEQAQYQILVRLRDPEDQLHTAAELLPIAESAGLLHRIDRRVLELAIDVMRERHDAEQQVRLFATQSALTLAREDHATWLAAALADAGIHGTSLVIDVRQEDAVIHALSLQEFCNAMAPVGVQLCISQYAPGIEVDALLAQLPLGFIRLASRYSSNLGEHAVCDEMRTTIEHAHRLGLQVIGQQVEDPQAAATLWMSGIDFIQGNLVQRAAGILDFDFQHSVL